MSDQIKLVIAQQTDGTKHQFMIYSNKIVGKGAFGQVKQAFQKSIPQKELVVKIIPYIDQKKRQKIQKELQIIKTLPFNLNLVDVRPFKCFSAKNYYIFMQYCKQGTLDDIIKKKTGFTQQQIFDFFYQFMSGYKVLYDRKILHQDIKPDNVLVKGNTYKITDFGFSIFHEGHKYGNIREGTLPYMPLQKLTQKQCFANTKIDVYAFGVILFKMIVGVHPWVKHIKQYKQYLKEMRNAKSMNYKSNIYKNFSIKFQHFFDLVIKMVAKKPTDRIDFDELFQYIETEQIFDKMRNRQKQHSIAVNFAELHLNITEKSNAVAIPFDVSKAQQDKLKNKAQQVIKNQKQQEKKALVTKLDNFIVSHRIIVYFFDRLARRIYVERLKKKNQKQFQSSDISDQQKVILGLLLFCRKIIKNVIKQTKSRDTKSNIFPAEDWKIYRKYEQNLLKMIQRDEQYLQDLIIDSIDECSQVKIKQRKQLLELSNQSNVKFIPLIKKLLNDFLETRLSLMKVDNRSSMITVKYILDGLSILDEFQKWVNKAQQLQAYFREIETLERQQILSRIMQQLSQLNIDFSLDLGQINQNEQMSEIQKRSAQINMLKSRQEDQFKIISNNSFKKEQQINEEVQKSKKYEQIQKSQDEILQKKQIIENANE